MKLLKADKGRVLYRRELAEREVHALYERDDEADDECRQRGQDEHRPPLFDCFFHYSIPSYSIVRRPGRSRPAPGARPRPGSAGGLKTGPPESPAARKALCFLIKAYVDSAVGQGVLGGPVVNEGGDDGVPVLVGLVGGVSGQSWSRACSSTPQRAWW